jgi:hypothetical protein
MDLLLSFFYLIISSVIGISIGLMLNMTSYIKIAFIVICVFIPLELYNESVIKKKKKTHSTNPQIINSSYITNPLISTPNITTNNSIPDYYPQREEKNIKFARQKDLDDTKYAIFKKKDSAGEEKDKLPLDGLSPKDLISSLNYITYSTANPYKPISYNNFKTHADKYLNEDGTKLSTYDLKLQSYSIAHYPQLTANQIDTRDCLNFGSGKDSCFQSAQLFSNKNNNFGILSKGVNEDNSNLIIKEDFTNPMILDPSQRYSKPLFKNAPVGNLDKILDSESNESINVDNSNDLCRNCKLAVCKDDYCSLQNQLFM